MRHIKALIISFVIAFSCFPESVFGQLENIRLSDKLLVNKFYAGFNSVLNILDDSLAVVPEASFRIGALITQDLTHFLQLESQGAIQISNVNSTVSIPSFEAIIKVSDRFQLRAGILVTPTTTTRPNPITWQSQVETYAQSRIIGGKPGGMLRYTVSDQVFVAYGIHNHDGQTWAQHVRLDIEDLRLAGYIDQQSEYFLSLKFTNPVFDSNLNYSSNRNEIASSLFYNLTDRFTLYGDANYFTDLNESAVVRLGARSYFRSERFYTLGFFAVAYDLASRITVAQLFFSIR